MPVSARSKARQRASHIGIDSGRRRLLTGAVAGAGLVLSGAFPAKPAWSSSSTAIGHDRIVRLSLRDGLEALRSGALTATDYCSAALAQAERFRDHHIFTQLSPTYARATAAGVDARRAAGESVGALEGVPYALKDSVDMVGYYTISGHPKLEDFEPIEDAELVRILRGADAICIGKTQIPVLSLAITTENPMTGDTGNPFNRAYKTGGSSGGSGAAVGARIVPFAIAEDTGGSIRIPAAMNGVQGFRPTTGRWPIAGAMPIGFSDTLGPIARTVADLKLLDSLCALDMPSADAEIDLKGVRIGYQQDGFLDDLHPWVADVVDDGLSRLSAAGARLVEIRGLDPAGSSGLALTMLLSEFPGAVARYLDRHRRNDLSAFALIRSLHMDSIKRTLMPLIEQSPTGEDFLDVAADLRAARAHYSKIMERNDLDALIYPTNKVPNTRNDGHQNTVQPDPLGGELTEEDIGNLMLFAPAMRTPSMALFAGLDPDGLPLAVTLDGHSGRDRRLLGIAEAAERVLPAVVEPESV
jgi:mandelamide amidase